MSDKATELIERMEAETGKRWDNDNPAAVWGLMGALSREMGVNPHGPREDVAVGCILAHSDEIRRRDEALLAYLKITGMVKGDGKP